MVNDVSFFQFTGHVLHRDAGADHQHQNMVGQITDLVNGFFLVLFFACNDDLGALFAHLFQDLLLALLEQVGGVAALLGAILAALDELVQALQFAAKRGVETIIIMPHIPDKKSAFMLAHSYYTELIEAGVKIYEYLPGFVHSKTFVSDGEKAVVGSVNMDFRSQYLNFECGVYIYENPVVEQIKKDFDETLPKCVRMTKESVEALPALHKFCGKAMRLIAPLM